MVGREENKEEIIGKLLSSNGEEKLSVVAIVGIGGLGKTTLAQLVYNDERVVNHFEFKIWACISDDSGDGFDVNMWIKKILKSLNDGGAESLETMKTKLHEKISQKRYLLVLDDVWNQNPQQWDHVRTLLMVGAIGSKLVVTTRKPRVASLMGDNFPINLKGLDENDSWRLFSKIAFKDGEEDVHTNITQIGKEIAKMCKGVPLIIKSLAMILRSKREPGQWLSIRNNKNLLSLGDENENVVGVLKLSYDNLPTHLRQCFTYCALFPKDYEIEKSCGTTMDSTRVKEFANTKTHKMLEFKKNSRQHRRMINLRHLENNGCFDWTHMPHGIGKLTLLQSLPLFVGGNFERKTISSVLEIGMETVGPRWGDEGDKCKILPPFSQLPSLKSLKLDDMKEAVELKEGSLTTPLFPSLESLELSDMPKLKELWRMDLLAEEGPSFSHLSQLEIRNCHNLASLELHSSPCLSQLEIIDCPSFLSLELHSSPCLSQLKISYCHNLASLELHSSPYLSQLEVRYCHNLASLELHSSPCLSKLEIGNCHDLASLELHSSPCLSKLEIIYCHNLASLELHSSPSLSQLHIGSCPNWHPSKWLFYTLLRHYLCSQSVSAITWHPWNCIHLLVFKLEIIYCHNLASFNVASLPRLEELSLRGVRAEVLRQFMFVSASSSLESLSICEIDGMISLPEEPLQYVSTLETLYIVKCSGLATLLHWMGSLSSLTELIIYDCSELTSLPEEIYSLKKLQTFYFCDYPHLEERYNKETGKDRAKIAHIPHVRFNSDLDMYRKVWYDNSQSLELHSSPSLSRLTIHDCPNLASFNVASLPRLEELSLRGVRAEVLRQFMFVSASSSLKSLRIREIDGMISLPEQPLQYVSTLETLHIVKCSGLATSLHWMGSLSSLTELIIYDCSELTSLPEEIYSLKNCRHFISVIIHT
ncbi:putative disease resistance protein RGA4 [Vitis vinifera]|uniref:Putative disease resistance protein RGA4 n=1 Tax=Vitis vinifera TaxID=29760 RepID=A0A438HYW7_VITVI|nr:putative disease resistance protein RGA4 [Vitis vinifera]